MRFTTKTEYGLNCLAYMAKSKPGELVTIKDMSEKEQFSVPYIEKILQKLRAANIVISHQGKGGGYSLARHPGQITFKEIVDALEGATFDVYCEPETREHIICTHLWLCGIRSIWAKTKELLDNFYSSITLEMIVQGNKNTQNLVQITGQ